MDPTAAIIPEAHTQIPSWGPNAQARAARRFDLFFTKATFLAGWGTVVLLAWITLQIAYEAWPAFVQYHLGFLFSQTWDTENDVYGALPFIYGTLVSSALALVLATPLGVAIAIFLTEDYLPPAAQDFFKFTVELLAAIPSVIYGLWGIAVVIPITNPIGNWLNAHFSWCPLFFHSGKWAVLPARLLRPGHHGAADHRRAFAHGAQGHAERHEGRRAGPRRHALGGDPPDFVADVLDRHRRRGGAGPRPRHGRDDGAGHAHRQQEPDQRLTFRARQHHRLAPGQQLRRGHWSADRRAHVPLVHPHGPHPGHQRLRRVGARLHRATTRHI